MTLMVCEILELRAKGASLNVVDECIEPGRCALTRHFVEGRHRTDGAALQLRCTLDFLLHRVVADLRTLHALFQLRRNFVEALHDRCRCDLRESENHHVREHLDLVGIIG